MTNLLSYALTTLADVKETLGIASSVTTYDNLIKRKINQATEMIEGYCGRRFTEQTGLVEYYDGNNDEAIILRNRPVTATTTFTLEGRATNLNENDFDTITSDLYFVDEQAGIINAISSFRSRYEVWKVTYSAGYSTIPSDVAEACATLAAYLYNNDASTTAGITSKEEGARKVQYGNSKVQFGSDPASANNLIIQLGLGVTLDRYSEIYVSGQR